MQSTPVWSTRIYPVVSEANYGFIREPSFILINLAWIAISYTLLLQSVFSTLSQGLEDDILESSIGRWAGNAATVGIGYCDYLGTRAN